MAWLYEIQYSKQVTATEKGFETHKAAMDAGRKRARELKAGGSLPKDVIVTVTARQDAEVSREKTS